MDRKKIEVSTEKIILEIIKNRYIDLVEDLVKIVKKEHNISQETTLKIIGQLQSTGKLTLQNPEPEIENFSEFNFIKFIRHNSNRDYWFILISAILGLFFSLIIENESSFTIFRAIFGIFAFFFSLGYLIADLAFFKEEMDIYEKITISIGLSTVISPLILYFINFTPLKLAEIYNTILYSIIILMGVIFLYIRFKKTDFTKLTTKAPIISRRRLFTLAVLCLLIAALVRAFNIYQYPLFGTPSDPWLHYGVAKAAINLKWFEFYYGAIYDVFYPLYYMTLVGLKFLSGFDLLFMCKTTPMIISVFSTFVLIVLSYRVTKKWEIGILTGLFSSTMDVITPVNSATLWPQTIGYMFFPLIIYAFLRVSEEKKVKNMILAIIFFSYLTVTHLVTIAALISALFLIAITLFYRKTYNKEFIYTLIICIGFFIGWGSIFYTRKLTELVAINISRLDFSLILVLGGSALLGLGIILFYLKRFGPTVRTSFELTFTKMSWLVIILVFGIGLNPLLWMFFPITSGFAQGLPLVYYLIIFIAAYPMLILGISGFRVAFHRGGMKDQFLTGWLMGLIIIAVLIMFGGNYLFSGRVAAFATGLFIILASIAIFSIFSTMKNRTRKQILVLSLITAYSTPFAILYRYPLVYGIEETQYSEYQSLSWLAPHIPSIPVFIGDNRALYLIDGVVWHPIMSLQFIGDLPMVEDLDQLVLLLFTGLLPHFIRLAMYPVFFEYMKELLEDVQDIEFIQIYIPIFMYYFEVGPIDLLGRDETIPTVPLTVYDLIILSNSENYNKIYDNWFAHIYIPNL
ncbi:MAG: hypothetical protein HWN67_06470 [Candidatus Helarchaeota archaeon]|nr:hypothetical protein [Candidatus Helarchaeota archaeon]